MEASSSPEVVQEAAPVAVLSPEETAHNEAMDSHFKNDEGLPQTEEAPKPNMFDGMNDEWKEANLKDGKLFGKFDNIEDMAKSYKKINDERANQGSEAKKAESDATDASNKAEVSNTQLSEIAANDFNITEDNFKAFEDAGYSRDQAENMAFKMEKAANKAYEIVGGKDNYASLMNWAGDNLSEAEIQTFADKTVGDNFSLKDTSTMAIEWLQFKMASSGVQQQDAPKQRISGNTPQRQSNGFGSKAEYNESMKYLRSNPSNRQAQAEYEAKMKVTDMRLLR